MAVAFDTSTAATGSVGTTTVTWNHTVTGSLPILLVLTTGRTAEATGVTYNGVALTKYATETGSSSTHTLWYLLNPPTGTHSVVGTWGTSGNGHMGIAASFTGVDQLFPFGNSISGNGTITNATVGTTGRAFETTQANGMLALWSTFDSGSSHSYGSGQTAMANTANAVSTVYGSYKAAATVGNFSMTESMTGAVGDTFYVYNQVALNPSGVTLPIYYFNASDASATDPGSAWTNDANAFNGDTQTQATASVAGSTSSNYLMAEGTNAPTSGGAITQVRARIYGQGQTAGSLAGPQANAAIYTNGLAELLGTAVTIASVGLQWGSYVTLTAPTGGWTWPKLSDLEVKIYATGSLGSVKAGMVEIEVTSSGFTKTHTTDTLLLKHTTKTHTTDAFLDTPPATGTATPIGLLLALTRQGLTTFTRRQNTDSLLRKITTRTHTTDTLIKTTPTRSHTTDSLLRSRNTKTHITDSLLRKVNTRSHTTDSLLRKQNTRAHTTGSLLHALVLKTHTTDTLLRAQKTKTHTTDSLLRAQKTKTHTTDSLLRKVNSRSNTTDTLLKQVKTRSHTTDSLLRKTNTRSHTTDSLLRGRYTRAHTTDTLLHLTFTRSHTADSLLKARRTVSHTTNSLLRAQRASTHLTDALLRKTNTRSHTTDTFLKIRRTLTHTVDSLLRAQKTRVHTSDSLLRKVNTKSHTTDSLILNVKRISQTTDSLLRGRRTKTHTTDSLLRKVSALSHTTNSLLRKIVLRSHTTDSIIKGRRTVQHSTNSLLRKATTLTHTTNSLLRRVVTLSHSTDTRIRGNRVRHSTDVYIEHDVLGTVVSPGAEDLEARVITGDDLDSSLSPTPLDVEGKLDSQGTLEEGSIDETGSFTPL